MNTAKWKIASNVVCLGLMFFCAQGCSKKEASPGNQQHSLNNKNNSLAGSAVPSPPASDLGQLYGITIESTDNLPAIIDSLKEVSRIHRPITRVVFQQGQEPPDYLEAVRAIKQESGIMGLISDSSAMHIYKTIQEYEQRTTAYITQLGDHVDIWEIGNEVNGEWVGWKDDEWEGQSAEKMASKRQLVSDQIKAAFNIAETMNKKTALTLYYNDDGVEGHQCWPSKRYGPEYAMFTWVNKYVTDIRMREKLDYVFVSFYEDDCQELNKDTETWVRIFKRLLEMFPNAKVGFGEFAPQCHMCEERDCLRCLEDQKEYIPRYYKTYNSQIKPDVPSYVGGFFYWYFRQDMVPEEKPALSDLKNAIRD